MKRITIDLIEEMTIYSGDEEKFDVFEHKKSIYEELKKFIDLDLFDELVEDDELKLVLKGEVFDENIYTFLNEMERQMGCRGELSEHYFDDDHIEKTVFKQVSEHLGIDIIYTEVGLYEVTDDNVVQFGNNLLRFNSANVLFKICVLNAE